jgi:hypothetical protein
MNPIQEIFWRAVLRIPDNTDTQIWIASHSVRLPNGNMMLDVNGILFATVIE